MNKNQSQDIKEKKICCDYGDVGEQHFCTQAGKVVNKPNSLPSQQIEAITKLRNEYFNKVQSWGRADADKWWEFQLKQELEACMESVRKEAVELVIGASLIYLIEIDLDKGNIKSAMLRVQSAIANFAVLSPELAKPKGEDK